MIAHRAGKLRDPFVIVGRQRPTFAVRAEILAGVKTESRRLTKPADSLPAITRAVGLAGIFDDNQSAAFCDFQNCLELDGPAIEVYRHDRFGSVGDCPLDLIRIDIRRGWIDIHEHRFSSGVGNRFSSGNKRIRRCDDFIARPDAGCQQCEMQSAGAGIQRHAVLRLAVCGKLLFKLRDLLAEDERRVLANPIERRKDFLAQASILCFQVKVRNSIFFLLIFSPHKPTVFEFAPF